MSTKSSFIGKIKHIKFVGGTGARVFYSVKLEDGVIFVIEKFNIGRDGDCGFRLHDQMICDGTEFTYLSSFDPIQRNSTEFKKLVRVIHELWGYEFGKVFSFTDQG